MDLATIIGLVVALGGIIGGLIVEGGNIMQITAPTAAMIVLGGTIGATMITFPLKTFITAMKGISNLFKPKMLDPGTIIEDLVKYSVKARKDGIISLEADVKEIQDPFLKKALMMAIDGADPKELHESLEMQLGYMAEHGAKAPKVWEAAGAYAPTVGIIGAVMGLIQVMGHLDNIEEVGHGIAVAFVATIYGLLCANIIMLPAAGKLAALHKSNMVVYEMVIAGVLLVIEGVNPMVMRDKLAAFFVDNVLKAEEEKK
ncbi:flagellar motor protein [bacterium]|nr:flagellar motor protein [bacterium]